MRIGIVIAIARELKAFLESNYEVDTICADNREIYHTIINGNDVYAIKSGYGLIDAAATTQYLICKYQIEKVFNFGVTGALNPELRVEDLFVCKAAINHDYDVSPIDPVKIHQYEEFEDEFIPFSTGLLDFACEMFPSLKVCVVASGDRFIEKKEDKDNLRALGADICDMEAAAIARIAYINKIDCLSIKCISDTYEGNGGDFNTNVTNSAKKAFSILNEILMNIY